MIFDGSWPLVEDNLWWKTPFDCRQPLIEDNLRRMTTLNGRWPSMEDIFDGRWTFLYANLKWNLAFEQKRGFCTKSEWLDLIVFEQYLDVCRFFKPIPKIWRQLCQGNNLRQIQSSIGCPVTNCAKSRIAEPFWFSQKHSSISYQTSPLLYCIPYVFKMLL